MNELMENTRKPGFQNNEFAEIEKVRRISRQFIGELSPISIFPCLTIFAVNVGIQQDHREYCSS
jgi:hypothetical protein